MAVLTQAVTAWSCGRFVVDSMPYGIERNKVQCVFLKCISVFRAVLPIFTCHTLSTSYLNGEHFSGQTIYNV